MYSKADLKEQLLAIGVNPKGVLKVHFSYKAMGEVTGGPVAVFEALREYMADGLLVIGTHTWRNVQPQNPVFDVLFTPSCIGVIPNVARLAEGGHRSLHPTHSVVAFGRGAADFVAGEEQLMTPCGVGGVYHKLWAHDAQILLVGVNFARNTFVHGIEEWDGAKGTISAVRGDYYTINHEGQRLFTPQYRHCARIGSETFTKLEPLAYAEGILTFGKLGNATTRLMSAKALRGLVAPLLEADPNYLNDY